MNYPHAYANAERAAPLIGDGPNVRYEAAPQSIGDCMSQVAAELNRLHRIGEVADGNANLIQELKGRLAPVLRPHPVGGDPRADGGNGACNRKQVEPLAPLAADIRGIGERIGDQLQESNAMLRWLLDALGI